MSHSGLRYAIRVLGALLLVGSLASNCQPDAARGAAGLRGSAESTDDAPSRRDGAPRQPKQRERIVVEVVGPGKPYAVGGARVAVVSEACREIGVGIVDGTGLGTIELAVQGDQPKWVLATRQGYFIGGVPWRGVRGTYYIDLRAYRDPPQRAGAEEGPGAAGPVTVEVQEARRGWPVGGARVTVFSDACRALASAVTDEEGTAALPLLPTSDRPRFVLAIRDGYFIGGLPWEEQRRRYWIDLPIFYLRNP